MSKAPALVAIERPAVDRSLTKSAYMGNLSRVRELLEPAAGKASDIAEKDMSVGRSRCAPCPLCARVSSRPVPGVAH